jgi:hypothetical protein
LRQRSKAILISCWCGSLISGIAAKFCGASLLCLRDAVVRTA